MLLQNIEIQLQTEITLGGPPLKLTKEDKNRYFVLSKADIVFDFPRILRKPAKIRFNPQKA